MTATGYIHGHPVFYDGVAWRYVADGALAPPMSWAVRPCPACSNLPVWCAECEEAHDACIGHIDGADDACCGHGVGRAYTVSGRT